MMNVFEALSRLEDWTHQMGANLKPRGADTYGEGMRDAKDQVSRIIRQVGRVEKLTGDQVSTLLLGLEHILKFDPDNGDVLELRRLIQYWALYLEEIP